METMIQPKIEGYRQLNDAEAVLMNEGKQIAAMVGEYVTKLQSHPHVAAGEPGQIGNDGKPFIDQRWIAIGKTELQQGFMALMRGIAQPTNF